MSETSFILTFEDRTCKYITVFGGRCGKDAEDGFCEEHQSIICTNCMEPTAVGECGFVDNGNNTVSDFHICLEPLCEKCQHTPHIPSVTLIPDRYTHVTKHEAALMEITASSDWHKTDS